MKYLILIVVMFFSTYSMCQVNSSKPKFVSNLVKVSSTVPETIKLKIVDSTKKKSSKYAKRKNVFLGNHTELLDPIRQRGIKDSNSSNSRNTLLSFDGINSNSNPHDPSIAVGLNNVVQMTNGPGGGNVIIFDKSGTVIVNQFALSTLSGIVGGGDGIVLYDQLADRWILTEFEPKNTGSDRFVIAVSANGDPNPNNTAYTIYSNITAPAFPDYPKYSIWGNSLIVTSNESENMENGIYAIDLTQLYAGNATSNFIRFDITDAGGQTDLFNPPSPVTVSGFQAPNLDPIILQLEDDGWCASCQDEINIYTINIDWNNPNNASLVGPTTIALNSFSTDLCGSNSFNCIPQQGSPVLLDPVSQIVMNSPSFRTWGNNNSIVFTFTVDVNASDLAGIRWVELQLSNNVWSVYQEGTFSPSDNLSRWMPTIDINKFGDIGLMYNVSGSNLFPSIRYTGRSACDQLGIMSYSEQTLVSGLSFNNSNRYGDYSGLVCDPSNDKEFWGTGMYTAANNDARTRIGNFTIATSNNIYVDSSNGSNGNGTIGNPYNSFLLAVSNACSRDIIWLKGGDYIESFPETFDFLELQLKSYAGSAIIR